MRGCRVEKSVQFTCLVEMENVGIACQTGAAAASF